MDVRMPDGTIVRNVPEGTTKEQLLQKLARRAYSQAQGQKEYSVETTPGEAFLIGAGQTLSNLWEGGKNIINKATGGDTSAYEQRRANDAEMMAGLSREHPVASAVGQIAPMLATAPLSGGILAQAGIGAGLGALETGGNLGQAGLAGVLSGAGAGAGKALGRGFNALRGNYGRSAGEGITEAVDPAWFPAGVQKEMPGAQGQFKKIHDMNQATLKGRAAAMVGQEPPGVLTGKGAQGSWDDMLAKAHRDIGSQFDAALPKGSAVSISDEMIETMAQSGNRTLQDVANKATANGGQISGRDAHKALQSYRRLGKSPDPNTRENAWTMTDDLFNAIEGGQGIDFDVFRGAQQQYKNLIALERGSGVLNQSGDISPAALRRNIRAVSNKRAPTNPEALAAYKSASRAGEAAYEENWSRTGRVVAPLLAAGMATPASPAIGTLAMSMYGPGVLSRGIQAAPAHPLFGQVGGALARDPSLYR